MRFYAEALGLSDTAFALLRDLVQDRTGMYFENSKADLLADKLSPLVVERGFDSFLDYYYLLKYDPAAQSEWQRVMDALSVQETFFWREMDQVHALVEHILPQFAAEHPRQTFHIWSAACASGEEPLTIAMALDQAGWFERIPLKIVGSDASPAALVKAQRGLYRERAFRNLPGDLWSKYFRPTENGTWSIDPELHARVEWRAANLVVDSDIAPLACAEATFCRNVFIYFSDATIRRTTHTFARHMPVPGYLFVGASESLLRRTTELELEEIGGAFVYVKRE